MSKNIDATAMLRPRREITGMSAILLPHTAAGEVDWAGFEAHVARTHTAGLTPAVNMDTGFVQLLDESTVVEVLDRTAAICGADFVAGAYIADAPGDPFNLAAYASAATSVAERGATPVIFASHGLNESDDTWLASYAEIAREVDRFIGFELGPMFVPYGRIVSLDTYGALLELPQCVGAKHSSLSRELEWQRLALRDERRPDFKVFTGNDLAIDMVMYGSDYLLGLSTMAPAEFALRDRMWASGDPGFYELNDLLQYLGHFTFRPDVPAYKHNAAMLLKLRGWIESDEVPPGADRRPATDTDVLADIALRLEGQCLEQAGAQDTGVEQR